ncbi:hypothetical protein BDV36DRAFT_242481 [Aspergillus pseudocaelatus]|uniref:C6H2-type domain-containing protein n=1 Tax=Aspergillus pseudocaelatus TaxID=1825620 RepID=A0ABQ6X3V1_9EURO|nr:hypothetical protein BDV36DRAFT_242481 [Aspergillus pseudocaelatus]
MWAMVCTLCAGNLETTKCPSCPAPFTCGASGDGICYHSCLKPHPLTPNANPVAVKTQRALKVRLCC